MSARNWIVLPCALLLGCGSSNNSINPAPVPVTDASVEAAVPEAGAPDQNAPDQEAGAVVRTITVRDPFGMLDPANLMHDGDFEFSTVHTMQGIWSGMSGESVVTGAACRSGMRCVRLNPAAQGQRSVSGWFVWPNAPYAVFEFYAAISGTRCDDEAYGSVMDMTDWNKRETIPATTPTPVDGWCHFSLTKAVDPGRNWYQVRLSARKEAAGPVIVDEMTLRGSNTAPENFRYAKPIPKDILQQMDEDNVFFAKLLPPNPPREPRPVRNPTGRRTH